MKIATTLLCLIILATGRLALAQSAGSPEETVSKSQYDALLNRLEKLEAELDTLKEGVNEPEGSIQTTVSDVKKLKKTSLSGYIQARYDSRKEEDKDTPEQFSIRRARIKVTANPMDRSSAVIQLDAGGDKVTLKDAYIARALTDNPAVSPVFYVGQMNWPFGYEVPLSSSKRETPERALVFRRFFEGERDKGAKITGPADSSIYWQLGLFNGSGINVSDFNNEKDIVASMRFGRGNLDYGISGYFGRGLKDNTGAVVDEDKTRYGADIQYYLENLTLKAEYVRGRGIEGARRDFTKWIDGYYAQAGLNVGKADTLVARYSSMSSDPVPSVDYGRRSAWDIGWIRWLDSKTRFKLFYEINNEEQNEIDNDFLRAEWLITY